MNQSANFFSTLCTSSWACFVLKASTAWKLANLQTHGEFCHVNMTNLVISSTCPFTLQEIRFYQPLLQGPPLPSDHLHICGHQRGPAERYPVPRPSLKIISEVNHLSCFDRLVWLIYRIFCEDISDLPIVSTLNVKKQLFWLRVQKISRSLSVLFQVCSSRVGLKRAEMSRSLGIVHSIL